MSKKKKKKQIKKTTSIYDYAVYKFDKPLNLGQEYNNNIIVPNRSILLPNRIIPRGMGKQVELLDNIVKPIPKNMNNSKPHNILVIREGGIGDIVASLFGLAELKIKYPNIKIIYMCRYKYHDLLRCFPKLIDSIIAPSLELSQLKKINYVIYLDKIIERNNENIHDIFSKLMYTEINEYTVDLVTSLNAAHQLNKERKIIGLQYKTNAIIRNYNIDKLCDLISSINKIYGLQVFLLGSPNDFSYVNYFRSKTKGGVISNGCGEKEYTLMTIISIMSQFKVVIAPDSSMLHIAGITETPMIGLFGPFPSKYRIKYYKNAIGIDSNSECSPCFRHNPTSFCKFNNGEGMCLNNIDNDLILENLDMIMKSYPS